MLISSSSSSCKDATLAIRFITANAMYMIANTVFIIGTPFCFLGICGT